MTFGQKWKAFWSPSLALVFDRETLWSVSGVTAEPKRSAASVALEVRTRKVVAVGDAAADLRGRSGENVTVVDYAAGGTLLDFDVAEMAFRHEVRTHLGSKLRIAPRIVVASSRGDIEKRVIKDAVVHAGARDVVVIPRLMAAAIGSGLEVRKCEAQVIVYLDRDWAGISIIGRANVLAVWEGADAFDQVLVDQAWQLREDGDVAGRDLDAMWARLKREGVLGAANVAANALVYRMREHYLRMLSSVSKEQARVARNGSVYLVGPSAKLPGLKELFSTCWGQPVVIPPRPEAVVILGCRSVLPELDWLFRSEK